MTWFPDDSTPAAGSVSKLLRSLIANTVTLFKVDIQDITMKVTSCIPLLFALVGPLDSITAFQVVPAIGGTGTRHRQQWMNTPTSIVTESGRHITALSANREKGGSEKKSIANRVGSFFLAASLALGTTTTGVLPLTPSVLPANAAEASKVVIVVVVVVSHCWNLTPCCGLCLELSGYC